MADLFLNFSFSQFCPSFQQAGFRSSVDSIRFDSSKQVHQLDGYPILPKCCVMLGLVGALGGLWWSPLRHGDDPRNGRVRPANRCCPVLPGTRVQFESVSVFRGHFKARGRNDKQRRRSCVVCEGSQRVVWLSFHVCEDCLPAVCRLSPNDGRSRAGSSFGSNDYG